MSYTIPSDSHVVGDPGHTADHNNIVDMLTLVSMFNVKNTAYGGGAKGDGVTNDAPAIQAAITAASTAGGGVIYYPPGTYLVGTSLTLPNGVNHWGSGQGVSTIKAAAALAGPVFTQVVASGHSIINVGWRNLTLDGNTGPSGSNIGILIDTSALNTTPYYNVKAEDVDFQNCKIGWQHAANNVNGTALFNETLCLSCRFYNNACGAVVGGTYASTFSDCLFAGNTIIGVGTSGFNGTPVLATATGPTTDIAVRGCHFEGLGNLTGGGTATESGVIINCTQYAVTDCFFANISRFPVQGQDNEGLGSVIDGIRIWGCGGAAVIAEGNSIGFTTISNVACSEVSQNSGLVTAFGQTGVISALGGNVSISNVALAPATGFGVEPPYALNLGADGNNACRIIDVNQLHCSSPTVSWLTIQNTQNAMTLKIRNSRGYNPQGTLTITVPATTVATAAQYVDAVFYVTGAAGGSCTITVSGGPTVTVPVSTLVPVFCPAGQTVTPVYGAGNAPTWAVEGMLHPGVCGIARK